MDFFNSFSKLTSITKEQTKKKVFYRTNGMTQFDVGPVNISAK
jgi:hypothetical protein